MSKNPNIGNTKSLKFMSTKMEVKTNESYLRYVNFVIEYLK